MMHDIIIYNTVLQFYQSVIHNLNDKHCLHPTLPRVKTFEDFNTFICMCFHYFLNQNSNVSGPGGAAYGSEGGADDTARKQQSCGLSAREWTGGASRAC